MCKILNQKLFQVRGDTVQHYTITYEQLTPKHTRAQTVTKAKSPYILENLGIVNSFRKTNVVFLCLGGLLHEYFIMCTKTLFILRLIYARLIEMF